MVHALALVLAASFISSALAVPLRPDEQRFPVQAPIPTDSVTPTDRDYQTL